MSHPSPPSSPAADRMHRLREAQQSIAKDASLPATLSRIVRVSCELVGARAGSLVVLGEDGGFDQIVNFGSHDAARGTTGDGRPTAPGGEALDLAISLRGRVLGHLHLVSPSAGRFDPADADALAALATFAAAAIDNARLAEDAQRSKDWLHASAEIARALLADADADALLDVVSQALHVAEADNAALILPTTDGWLKAQLSVGLGANVFRGLIFDPARSRLGQVITSGQSLLAADFVSVATADYTNDLNFGPLMVAPLVDAHGVRGGVVLIRTAGRAPFTPRDLDLATTFADQVALALQLNDARLDARSLHVLEDRHEVSKALHDSVMQRLFATGMGLQGLADRDLPGHLTDRLRRHICDLDETIDEIRASVFKAPSAADGLGDEDRFARMPHDAGLPV